MKNLMTALALSIGLATVAARAQGDANIASDYPDPHCARPEVKLIKPGYTGKGNIEDSGLAGAYNQKVKIYNREAQDYDSCMHAYIDGANVELKRVQNDANAQIRLVSDTANTRLRLIEGKVAAAIRDANQVAQDEGLKHK